MHDVPEVKLKLIHEPLLDNLFFWEGLSQPITPILSAESQHIFS
jgi:hypothetical protein